MYEYIAIRLDGSQYRGKWSGEDLLDLNEYLEDKNHYLLKVRKKTLNTSFFSKKLSIRELYIFTQKIHTLLRAGIPLSDSLMSISEESKKMKLIVDYILEDLEEGTPISDSMDRIDYFPKHMVQSIRVGEISGDLNKTFENLNIYYKKAYELQNEIRSNLTYPIFLSVTSVFLLGFLIIVILPKFETLFLNRLEDLPRPTRYLLGFKKQLKTKFFRYPLYIYFIFLLGKFVTRSRTKDGNFHYLAFKVPFLKGILKKLYTFKLSNILYTMLSSGIEFYQALKISIGSFSNKYYRDNLEEILLLLENGRGISKAIEGRDIFPDSFQNLISIGEEAGDLTGTLGSLRDEYSKNLGFELKRYIKLIEPLVLLIMSLFIGFIVIGIMLPMMEIGNSFI